MEHTKSLFVALLTLTLVGVFGKPQGSKCSNTDGPGTCTPVPDCSAALDSIRSRGYHELKRCGFDKFTEIVCCPEVETRHVKTTEPSSTDKAIIRGTEVERKSEKACSRYAKDLPVVLSYHIVGGENAEVGEFPHMAALAFFSEEEGVFKFECGGTLISEQYVVTAAHCLVNIQGSQLRFVRLGQINVTENVEKADPKFDYDVDNVTVFQKYNWKEKLNDIALVKLKKKVTFTDFIRPACLYTKSDDPEQLIVTGWGAVGLGAERSVVLQKASLTSVSLHECNSTYQTRTNRYVTKSQLCAADNRSDACQGDSGGPLQTQGTKSILSVVGVTSYGIGCGSKYPGIYTRISSYLDWIEDIVWP